jgi:Fe-S-cluster containining protein
VNCLECRGACCEELVVPFVALINASSSVAEAEWMGVRASSIEDGRARFDVRCPKLDACGRCSVHDEKPLICAVYPAGGPDCLDVVRRRRTADQYQRIREAGDPESIHARS